MLFFVFLFFVRLFGVLGTGGGWDRDAGSLGGSFVGSLSHR